MTTYEQLHNKICKLIPEIKELKFGCKIKIKHESIIDYYIDDCVLRTDQFKMPNSIKFIETINGKKISSDSESFEIIGRDITLFDIKQCLIYNNYTNDFFLKVSDMWLYPDSLDKQSEELKNYLSTLLCKKE